MILPLRRHSRASGNPGEQASPMALDTRFRGYDEQKSIIGHTGLKEGSRATSISVGPSAASAAASALRTSSRVSARAALTPMERASAEKSMGGSVRSMAT